MGSFIMIMINFIFLQVFPELIIKKSLWMQSYKKYYNWKKKKNVYIEKETNFVNLVNSVNRKSC